MKAKYLVIIILIGLTLIITQAAILDHKYNKSKVICKQYDYDNTVSIEKIDGKWYVNCSNIKVSKGIFLIN